MDKIIVQDNDKSVLDVLTLALEMGSWIFKLQLIASKPYSNQNEVSQLKSGA